MEVMRLIARMNREANASAHTPAATIPGPKAWIGDLIRAHKDGFEGRIYEVHADISTVYQAEQRVGKGRIRVRSLCAEDFDVLERAAAPALDEQ